MFTYSFAPQIILIKLSILVISTPLKVLEKGILPLERNSVAVQFFIDVENEDKWSSCIVQSQVSKCCLIDEIDTDCDCVKLHGEYTDLLKPKDRKTYLFFYLTMSQLNQEGYCTFRLDRSCGTKIINQTEEINIPFDTRLKKMTKYLHKNYKTRKVRHCKSIDEDPLNDCIPVSCDLKYFGAKPIFDKKRDKCIVAPECSADLKKNLPDIVFDPVTNTCKDLEHPLSVANIYAINAGLGVVVSPKQAIPADVKPFVLKTNCSTISQNLLFLKDVLYGHLNQDGAAVDFNKPCKNAIKSLLLCVIGISSLVILFVCCVQTMAWLCKSWRRKSSKIEPKHCYFADQYMVNREITNKLLRDVLVTNLPLDQRASIVDVGERIEKEVKWKNRYRMKEFISDMNIRPAGDSSDTSTTSDLENSEKERLLQ